MAEQKSIRTRVVGIIRYMLFPYVMVFQVVGIMMFSWLYRTSRRFKMQASYCYVLCLISDLSLNFGVQELDGSIEYVLQVVVMYHSPYCTA